MLTIYYINLESDSLRRKIIEASLLGADYCVARIKAAEPGEPPKLHEPQLREHSWSNTRWEIDDLSLAVFRSHHRAWSAFVDSDATLALIMEDDLAFSPRFFYILKLITQMEFSFDILRINTFVQTRHFGKPEQWHVDVTVWPIIQEMADAGAYVITQSACQKLLEDSNSFCDHLDDFIFSPRRRLNTYQLAEPICGQFIHNEVFSNEAHEQGLIVSHRDLSVTRSSAKGPLLYRLQKEGRRIGLRIKLAALKLMRKIICVSGKDLQPYLEFSKATKGDDYGNLNAEK